MGLLPLRSRIILLGVIIPFEIALVLFSSLFPAAPISPSSFYGNSFSGQKVFLFVTMVPVGFMFVAALNKRRNVILSRKKNYVDFFVTTLLGIIAFFLIPIRTIHAAADNDFTSPSTADVVNWNFPATEFESLVYNFCLYVVPFIVGLHFRLKELLEGHDRILLAVTWKKVRENYRTKDYFLVGTIALISAAVAGFHVYLLYLADLLVPYAAIFCGPVLVYYVVQFSLRKTHFMRWRYYMLTGFLVFFTPFQNVISAVTQGLLLGITVEGITTKGLSNILLRRPTSSSSSRAAANPAPDTVEVMVVTVSAASETAALHPPDDRLADNSEETMTGDEATLLPEHERESSQEPTQLF